MTSSSSNFTRIIQRVKGLFCNSHTESQTITAYKIAAKIGDASAQYSLGNAYYFGEGVLKDYTQAVYWFQKAAEQGFPDAQFNLGVVYYHRNGVSQDDNQAVYWFRKAAEQGFPIAKKILKKVFGIKVK